MATHKKCEINLQTAKSQGAKLPAPQSESILGESKAPFLGRMDFRTLLSRCSAPSLAILSPLGKKVMAGEINGIILVVGLEGEYTRQKYILTAFPGHPQVLLSLQLPGSNSNHYSLAMLVQAAFSYSVNIESETGPPIGGGMLLIRLDERNVSAIDYSKKYRRECNARAEPAVQRLADEIGFGRLDEFVRDGL